MSPHVGDRIVAISGALVWAAVPAVVALVVLTIVGVVAEATLLMVCVLAIPIPLIDLVLRHYLPTAHADEEN